MPTLSRAPRCGRKEAAPPLVYALMENTDTLTLLVARSLPSISKLVLSHHQPDQDGVRGPLLLGDRADGAHRDGRCNDHALLGRQVFPAQVVEETTGESTGPQGGRGESWGRYREREGGTRSLAGVQTDRKSYRNSHPGRHPAGAKLNEVRYKSLSSKRFSRSRSCFNTRGACFLEQPTRQRLPVPNLRGLSQTTSFGACHV